MADCTNVSLQKLNHSTVGKINFPPRLCGSLENIKKRYDAEVESKHPHMCVVCGESTYSRCSTCNAYLQYLHWK